MHLDPFGLYSTLMVPNASCLISLLQAVSLCFPEGTLGHWAEYPVAQVTKEKLVAQVGCSSRSLQKRICHRSILRHE